MPLGETPHPVPKHVEKALKAWGLQTLALGESSTAIGVTVKGDESPALFRTRIMRDETDVIIEGTDLNGIDEIWGIYLHDVFVENQRRLRLIPPPPPPRPNPPPAPPIDTYHETGCSIFLLVPVLYGLAKVLL